MRRVFITRHCAVYSEQATPIKNLAVPMAVNMIAEIYAGADKGTRLPMHNLYRLLRMRKFMDGVTGPGGFFFAAGNVAAAGLDLEYSNPKAFTSYTYRIPIYSGINIFAGQCANEIGMTEVISTDASACASSMNSLWMAWTMLRLGEIDRAVVVACEEQTTNMMLEFFGKAGVALTLEREEAGGLPSAFDDTNGGFRIGNGAAAFLLEVEGNLTGEPIAELTGVALSGEQHMPALGQDAEGSGYVSVLKRLMKHDARQPDLIKTHGTGTTMNNQAERAALDAVFGKHFIATSYKPLIGHTMGASGLVEMSLLLRDTAEGFAPGIPNRTAGGDERFLRKNKQGNFRQLLCLSAGMGNVYGGATLHRLDK